MKVWIDLANSPHPLLFAPVGRRLEELGHRVLVTARDNAQTLELARERWPHVDALGNESPAGRMRKAGAIAGRVEALRRWARAWRPDVALSHNSYAQIVAARLCGIPAVTAMDYEHQPANHVAFRLAQVILLPEALPAHLLRRQGATVRKVRTYPGLKEELYLGDFEPDASVASALGVPADEATTLVVTRTPPARALYHRIENIDYAGTLRTLGQRPGTWIVALARHPEQRTWLAELGLERLITPEHAVDARSLMYQADLVIGAGGTMTREAALLGIPTYSVFAGRPAAVDSWLVERGALRRIESVAQLAEAGPRAAAPIAVGELRRRGQALVDAFADAAVAAR